MLLLCILAQCIYILIRFPAQEQVGGDSKIPTIIYYDQAGSVCAAGAEAVREGIDDMAEDGQWIKAEWYKIFLLRHMEANDYRQV